MTSGGFRSPALALGAAALAWLTLTGAEPANAAPHETIRPHAGVTIHRPAMGATLHRPTIATAGVAKRRVATRHLAAHRYAVTRHGYGFARRYGYGGAAVYGAVAGAGYAYPAYEYGYGYAYPYRRYYHHNCWWYRHYEPYNAPSWCATYSYGYAVPSYSYGYAYGGYWRGGYYHRYAAHGARGFTGVTRVAHIHGARVHGGLPVHANNRGLAIAHGGARFAATGDHPRAHFVR